MASKKVFEDNGARFIIFDAENPEVWVGDIDGVDDNHEALRRAIEMAYELRVEHVLLYRRRDKKIILDENGEDMNKYLRPTKVYIFLANTLTNEGVVVDELATVG